MTSDDRADREAYYLAVADALLMFPVELAMLVAEFCERVAVRFTAPSCLSNQVVVSNDGKTAQFLVTKAEQTPADIKFFWLKAFGGHPLSACHKSWSIEVEQHETPRLVWLGVAHDSLRTHESFGNHEATVATPSTADIKYSLMPPVTVSVDTESGIVSFSGCDGSSATKRLPSNASMHEWWPVVFVSNLGHSVTVTIVDSVPPQPRIRNHASATTHPQHTCRSIAAEK